MRYSFEQLADFGTALFGAVGVEPDAARTASLRLVDADLRGRTGHGLMQAEAYLRRLRSGGINPTATMRVRQETPASAQIDADNGLGHVAMTMATELVIEKAGSHGIAIAGTVNSNHAGAAGIYPAMVARHDLVGMYFAVANANAMPPWGGTTPLLGTNPVAIAMPSGRDEPFVLDIATTTASIGAIEKVAQVGGRLPEGWVVDAAGQPITDPAEAMKGYLVPIGGYKGSGLATAIGMIAGVLNGAAFAGSVVDLRSDPDRATNTGQMIVAFRADLFRPLEAVLDETSQRMDELRQSGGVDGGDVRLPGDAAAATIAENLEHGIPLSGDVRAGLNRVAAEFGAGQTL